METRSLTRRAPASAFFVVALALGAMANGCGREPSMASRSAAAYQEAVDKGLPIGSGHAGHGEENSADSDSMAGMDHSEPAGEAAPMAGMDHTQHTGATSSPMAGMDHSKPAGGPADPMVGMRHSKPAKPGGAVPMPGMDHSQPASGKPGPMAGMDHSKPAGETADPMAGMDHGAMGHGAMGHGSPSAIPPSLPSPKSSSAIGQLDPSKTLAPDEFDQVVAPVSQVQKEKP